MSVSLTFPALANVSAVAVSGDGNGAAGGPVGSGVEVARARRMLHVVLVSPLVSGNCCLILKVGFELSFLWPNATLSFKLKFYNHLAVESSDWCIASCDIVYST